MNTRALATLFVIVLFLGALVQIAFPLKARAQSGAHGDGHAQMHDEYKGWKKPDNPNVSCCDNTDCRPTRAYVGDDGLWRAWNGHKWLTVPREVMLPKDLAKDGRSHICEKSEYIFCFSAAEPKS